MKSAQLHENIRYVSLNDPDGDFGLTVPTAGTMRHGDTWKRGQRETITVKVFHVDACENDS